MPRSKSPSSKVDRKKKYNETISLQSPLLILSNEETDPENLRIYLQERIKELNCLYQLSALITRDSDSIDEIMETIVNTVPSAWRYPEITCARIMLNGKVYKSRGFKITKWVQSSQIFIANEPTGKIEVFYFKRCPSSDEGPFLREERLLLDAVSEGIGKIVWRITTEQRLREISTKLAEEHLDLQKTKEALRTVLTMVEDEKRNNV